MKLKVILALMTFLLLHSCRSYTDEELTMDRQPYTGTEIRLAGCYSEVKQGQDKYCEYLFFYSNGVFFGFSDLYNINSLDQVSGGIDIYRNSKSSWGVFVVENKTIKVQHWGISDNERYQAVRTNYFQIINDTTISVDYLNDGDINYYHFKQFNPKPDSTNVYIKQ